MSFPPPRKLLRLLPSFKNTADVVTKICFGEMTNEKMIKPTASRNASRYQIQQFQCVCVHDIRWRSKWGTLTQILNKDTRASDQHRDERQQQNNVEDFLSHFLVFLRGPFVKCRALDTFFNRVSPKSVFSDSVSLIQAVPFICNTTAATMLRTEEAVRVWSSKQKIYFTTGVAVAAGYTEIPVVDTICTGCRLNLFLLPPHRLQLQLHHLQQRSIIKSSTNSESGSPLTCRNLR